MNHFDETKDDVRRLKNAVFGNPENPKETPGVVAELAQMNLILIEIRNSMRWINRLVVAAFITALCVMVFKQQPPIP